MTAIQYQIKIDLTILQDASLQLFDYFNLIEKLFNVSNPNTKVLQNKLICTDVLYKFLYANIKTTYSYNAFLVHVLNKTIKKWINMVNT